LFQRIGELIDLSGGDTVSLDGADESACLDVEFGKWSLITTRPTMKFKRSAPAGAVNCWLLEDGRSPVGLGVAGRKVCGVT
jgi:hypothetical protein